MNNQTKKLIKLESLENIQIESKLPELSSEEVSFIQGGWSGTTPNPSSPWEPISPGFPFPNPSRPTPKCSSFFCNLPVLL